MTRNAALLLPDQIEVVSQLCLRDELSHISGMTQNMDKNIKQFHPQPFLFMFDQQLDNLEELRQQSEIRTLNEENRISTFESEHSSRIQQLNASAQHISYSFSLLNKHVSH